MLTCENTAHALKAGASLLYHSMTTALGLRLGREEAGAKLEEERDRENMKIGLDCSLVPGERAGIGRYAYQLAQALGPLDLQNQYVL